MIAMEAATPFQIFSCINLVKKLNESADLFLYTYATELRPIAEHLKNENIFRHIYVIDNIPQGSRKSLISYLLFPRKMFSGIKIEHYEALFISYSGIPNLLLYNVLKSKNEKLTLHFYEDGVTSYYRGVFEHSTNVKKLCCILGLHIDSDHIEKVWLYEPRLNSVEYKDVRMGEICPIFNKDDIALVERVFHISEKAKSMMQGSDLLYFDHDFKKYITKDIFINFDQNMIVNEISQRLKHEIVVKISPLADEMRSLYKGELITASNFDKAPWEMLICNDRDIQNRCLVSVCSNAVVTPKTVYGKEPYVLILGKVLAISGCTNSTDVWTDDMEKFYLQVKNLYQNKSKFMIPETMEETVEMLKNFLDEKSVERGLNVTN